MSTFAPVHRESTRSKVYTSIREAILAGRVKTGQRLVEIPLAREFAVSRAIIREALQQLAHEGLVQQNGYKGTRVVMLTPQEIDEIVSVRLLLECEAVRLAHPNVTAAHRAEWRAIAADMAREADFTRFGQLDFDLHRQVWRVSGNQTMVRMLEQIAAPLFAMSLLMRSAEQRTRTRKDQRRGDHTALVEALCGPSGDAAVHAMRFHLTENWNALRTRLQQFLSEEGAL